MLAQAPLRPGSQTLFAAIARAPVSHVRLKIFPDGGVARLRVFGRVAPLWQRDADADAAAFVTADAVDLDDVGPGLRHAHGDRPDVLHRDELHRDRDAGLGGLEVVDELREVFD